MTKSGGKKISGKTKKPEVKKKVGTASKSVQKTAVKKKLSKSGASKVKEKKTPAKKHKTKGKIQVSGEKKQKKIEVKPGIATKKAVTKKAVPKRTIKKTPPKTPIKTKKKAEALQKVEKPPKTIRVKTTAKHDSKEKARKIKKTTKKIPEKSRTSKPLEKLPRKPVKPQIKKKQPEKIKEPEKVERGKAAREPLTGKKPTPQKLREAKQIKKTKVFKEAKKVKEIPKLGEIKADTIPTGPPAAKVPFPPTPLETLPSEYGENSVILMTVNPYKLFAFWEVRKATLNIFRGNLHLRVYDVTDIDFDTTDAHSFIERVISERIGKMYLDVSPAKEYVADIGIVYNGIFIGIARSPRVSTPVAGVPEEEEFLPEIMDVGIRIGY
jgi:Domain of unknown function (DUF4912)